MNNHWPLFIISILTEKKKDHFKTTLILHHIHAILILLILLITETNKKKTVAYTKQKMSFAIKKIDFRMTRAFKGIWSNQNDCDMDTSS